LLAVIAWAVALHALPAVAHPHVFVDARMEVVRDSSGKFAALRQVWRFDELFSATMVLDFDSNGNNTLEGDELEEITTIVKSSIAEYDFYTAIRRDGKPVEFYEPEEFQSYMKDNQLFMFLELEVSKPFEMSGEDIRLSASDSSYYVAFEFDEKTVSVEGDGKACNVTVTHPDFDKLFDDEAASAAFFSALGEEPDAPTELGDQFYSWANLQC